MGEEGDREESHCLDGRMVRTDGFYVYESLENLEGKGKINGEGMDLRESSCWHRTADYGNLTHSFHSCHARMRA